MARNGTVAEQRQPVEVTPLRADPSTGPSPVVPPSPGPGRDDPNYPETEFGYLPHNGGEQHALSRLEHSVREHFRQSGTRANVFYNVLVEFRNGGVREVRAPDLFVGLGHPEEKINFGPYLLEEGERPDFVLEMLSPSTAAFDKGAKKELYRGQGVPEYVLYEPKEGKPGPNPKDPGQRLQGFRLEGGKYVEIPPEPDGSVVSQLGFTLYPEGVNLRVRNTRTGINYRWPEEDARARREAEARIERDVRARKETEARIERDVRARKEAEARIERDVRARKEAETRAKRARDRADGLRDENEQLRERLRILAGG